MEIQSTNFYVVELRNTAVKIGIINYLCSEFEPLSSRIQIRFFATLLTRSMQPSPLQIG
jgi:hypothetical protein